eukprot:1159619-Pelagomonas_calceolata.AAC.12
MFVASTSCQIGGAAACSMSKLAEAVTIYEAWETSSKHLEYTFSLTPLQRPFIPCPHPDPSRWVPSPARTPSGPPQNLTPQHD